jgi:hypothetical protein
VSGINPILILLPFVEVDAAPCEEQPLNKVADAPARPPAAITFLRKVRRFKFDPNPFAVFYSVLTAILTKAMSKVCAMAAKALPPPCKWSRQTVCLFMAKPIAGHELPFDFDFGCGLPKENLRHYKIVVARHVTPQICTAVEKPERTDWVV